MTNLKGSTSRYVLVALCVVVVLTTLALVIMNYWTKNSGMPALDQVLSGQTYEDGYKAGFLAAREKFSKTPVLPQGMEVKSVFGEVKTVNKDSLTVLVTSLDTDPMVDGVSDTRTVNINKDTKIFKQISLSVDEFRNKMDAWNQSDKSQPMPQPFKEVAMSLSDLKAGTKVTITSNEDVRLKDGFLATAISTTEAAPSMPMPQATN